MTNPAWDPTPQVRSTYIRVRGDSEISAVASGWGLRSVYAHVYDAAGFQVGLDWITRQGRVDRAQITDLRTSTFDV